MVQRGNFRKVKKAGAEIFGCLLRGTNFATGEMAERSIAAVLKTVEGQTSGGSNPSLSANQMDAPGFAGAFLFEADGRACSIRMRKTKMEGAIAPGIHLIEAPLRGSP
jgi:hypothetical protein